MLRNGEEEGESDVGYTLAGGEGERVFWVGRGKERKRERNGLLFYSGFHQRWRKMYAVLDHK